MEKKRITVKIDPMGNPEIEAHGFQGQGCAEATRGIEKAFGSGGMNREYKEEWQNSGVQGQEDEQHQHSW